MCRPSMDLADRTEPRAVSLAVRRKIVSSQSGGPEKGVGGGNQVDYGSVYSL